MADFQRSVPDARSFLRRGPSILARSRIDLWLLLPVLCIMGLGLVVLYSGAGASEEAVNKQLLRYGVALLGMLIMAHINLREIERFVPVFYVIGVLLLVAVLLFGVGAKGAQRWLQVFLSLIHISEPTRLRRISYAVFCLKKKKKKRKQKNLKLM